MNRCVSRGSTGRNNMLIFGPCTFKHARPLTRLAAQPQLETGKYFAGTLRLVGTGIGGVLGYLVMLRSSLATRSGMQAVRLSLPTTLLSLPTTLLSLPTLHTDVMPLMRHALQCFVHQVDAIATDSSCSDIVVQWRWQQSYAAILGCWDSSP